MWSRVMEVAVGVWLALSPFIFRDIENAPPSWVLFAFSLIVISLALVCYWPPASRAHLLTLLVATGMVLWGRFSVTPPTAAHQNVITVGFVLMMLSIIPSDCLRPPASWRNDAH